MIITFQRKQQGASEIRLTARVQNGLSSRPALYVRIWVGHIHAASYSFTDTPAAAASTTGLSVFNYSDITLRRLQLYTQKMREGGRFSQLATTITTAVHTKYCYPGRFTMMVIYYSKVPPYKDGIYLVCVWTDRCERSTCFICEDLEIHGRVLLDCLNGKCWSGGGRPIWRRACKGEILMYLVCSMYHSSLPLCRHLLLLL